MNCITKLNILLRLTNPDTIFVLYAYFDEIKGIGANRCLFVSMERVFLEAGILK